MTREEEAIKILKEDGCGYCTWQSINPYKCENKECKVKEALNMAIHALEKENIYDDKEHYVTISKALYDKLNIDYEKALSQEPICPSAGVDCEDCPAYEAMREFTEEEAKAYSKALNKMYKPTGFNVFDEPCEVEAAKLQQAYDKGFEDCRQAVLDLINADWEYEGLEVPVNSLLPVTQNPETVTEFADRCRECGARYGKLLKQKSGKWIPCSERLPEKSDRYLAYIVNRHDDKLQYIMTCDYSVDGYWNWFPDAESASDNVIAWMPLPKPFEPQERSEQV